MRDYGQTGSYGGGPDATVSAGGQAGQRSRSTRNGPPARCTRTVGCRPRSDPRVSGRLRAADNLLRGRRRPASTESLARRTRIGTAPRWSGPGGQPPTVLISPVGGVGRAGPPVSGRGEVGRGHARTGRGGEWRRDRGVAAVARKGKPTRWRSGRRQLRRPLPARPSSTSDRASRVRGGFPAGSGSGGRRDVRTCFHLRALRRPPECAARRSRWRGARSCRPALTVVDVRARRPTPAGKRTIALREDGPGRSRQRGSGVDTSSAGATGQRSSCGQVSNWAEGTPQTGLPAGARGRAATRRRIAVSPPLTAGPHRGELRRACRGADRAGAAYPE